MARRFDRGLSGRFQTCKRRCRKRARCQFAVIELEEEEPIACETFADAPHPSACVQDTRCSAHGGTQCRRWRIRGPVLGYNTDAELLSSISIWRAPSFLPAEEVYVRAVPILTKLCYKTQYEAYASIRAVARRYRRERPLDDGSTDESGSDDDNARSGHGRGDHGGSHSFGRRGGSSGANRQGSDLGGGGVGGHQRGRGRSGGGDGSSRVDSGAGEDLCSGAGDGVVGSRSCSGVSAAAAASSFQSSFRGTDPGQHLQDSHIKLILKKAKATVASARNRLHKGHVALVMEIDALGDPVYKMAVKSATRRRSVGAIRDWRKKGGDVLRARWGQLLDSHAAGHIQRLRKWLEHGTRGPGGRATRLRLARGVTQMRMLPTREQLRTERRVVLDADDVHGHFLFTTTPLGRLERWDYVRGSSSEGLRRYQNKFAAERRLKSHNNKHWDTHHRRDAGEESEHEDGGVYVNNLDAETEGCYAPLETDPVRIEELLLNADSFVEDMVGGNESKVVAVGFDALAALQSAINHAVKQGTTAAAVEAEAPLVMTFAADGGTVRRKEVTAFTVSLSLPCLENGRTDLTPIVYCLSGEKRVGRDIASYINGVLVDLLSHSFTVPVAAAQGADDDAIGRHRLVLHPTFQVCGT